MTGRRFGSQPAEPPERYGRSQRPSGSIRWLSARILNAAGCAGTGFCMAVGQYSASTNFQTLTGKWNGTSWSLVSSPEYQQHPGQPAVWSELCQRHLLHGRRVRRHAAQKITRVNGQG